MSLVPDTVGLGHRFVMNAGTAGLILHVDDERSVRESLSMLLRADGYVVSSAASGTEALQLASAGCRPDVLIVDFNSPSNDTWRYPQLYVVIGIPPRVVDDDGVSGDVDLSTALLRGVSGLWHSVASPGAFAGLSLIRFACGSKGAACATAGP